MSLSSITSKSLRRTDNVTCGNVLNALTNAFRAVGLNWPRRAFSASAVGAVLLSQLLIGLILVPRISAQTQTSSPEKPVIDVASVRPNRTGGRSTILFEPANGRPTATNVTLKYLIKWAYNVEDYQISGGPKWIDSASFDIRATLVHDVRLNGSPVQRSYFREMIQPLLADRFKLVVHRTTRELPVYALVTGKNGPKLQDSKEHGPENMRMTGGRGLMVGQYIPIDILREALQQVVGRPVANGTGLSGYYDFRLQWDPGDDTPANSADGATSGSVDPAQGSIFTTLQEQLGLRLDARRGLVEVLVIDSAELPSEN